MVATTINNNLQKQIQKAKKEKKLFKLNKENLLENKCFYDTRCQNNFIALCAVLFIRLQRFIPTHTHTDTDRHPYKHTPQIKLI